MANVVVPLLLARHGETADNADGLILGHRDPPLSRAGREQAAALAASLGTAIVAMWCSPLLRARQTAEIVADALGVEPTVLDDLIESDRGTGRASGSRRSRRPRPSCSTRSRPPIRVSRSPAGSRSLIRSGARARRSRWSRRARAVAGRRPCRDDPRRDDAVGAGHRGSDSATARRSRSAGPRASNRGHPLCRRSVPAGTGRGSG